MDFYAVLDEVLHLLQRHKRVTYRALKRQFGLDDAYLEDLKAEIIEARQLAVDQDGTMLVRSEDATPLPVPTSAPVVTQDRTPLAYTPKHLADKILISHSALEGERKQVTVLFADVAGFTTLAEQLDPEVVHDIMNRCFERITAEVHRFEGTINQYTGDGVMALFGAPIAHEDSPRRAVHAALGIQRAISDVAQALQAERGLSLQREDGTYRLVKSLSEVSVPDTIQGIIMARLDRLGEDGKRTVQLASVIGRQFLVRLLERIAGLSDRLEGLLHELQALEIIYEQGLLPEPAYIFKHAVIQDVAYNSLLMQRRKALHRAVGEAIEALYQERLEEHYAELAHHFSQGEVWDKAFDYCRQAGTRAAARSAHREAVTYFEQALAALGQLPECRDTLEQAIDVRFDLYRVLMQLNEHTRVLECLRTTEPLAEQLGDDQRLGRIATYLGLYFSAMGEYDHAITAHQRALALATSSGAFDVQGVVQTFMTQACYAGGDFREGLNIARRAMALLTAEHRYANFGMVSLPYMTSRGYVALGQAELGGFTEGSGVGQDAVRVAEEVGQPFSLAGALIFVGFLYRRQGDVHKAIPMLERGLALCQTADILRLFPMAASVLGAAYTLAERVADALPLLDQTLERVAPGRRVIFQALVLTELGEALFLVGRVEEARALAGRLLEHSRTQYRAWLSGACLPAPRRGRHA